jgi:hypothetical protein
VVVNHLQSLLQLLRYPTAQTLDFKMSAEKKPDTLEKFETSSVNAATLELGISEPVNALQRFCNRLDAICGVEARGIERIPEEMRDRDMTYRDYTHMFTM